MQASRKKLTIILFRYVMESLVKTTNQLWILASVAAAVYVLNSQILQPVLNFNLVFFGKEKIVTTAVFLAWCIHFVYEYWRTLKSRSNENSSEENCKEKSNFTALNSGNNEDDKCSLRTLSEFSNVYWKSHKRNYSFPMARQQEFCYDLTNSLDRKNITFKSLLKREKEKALPDDSGNTHHKGSEEIPVVLHNLVKEIDLVLEQVKSLNHAFEKRNNDFYTDIQNTNTSPMRLNLGEEHVVNDWSCEPQSLSGSSKVIDFSKAVSSLTSKHFGLMTAENSTTISENGSSTPHELKMNEFRTLRKKCKKLDSCHQQILKYARDKLYPQYFTPPGEDTKMKSSSELHSTVLRKRKPDLV